MNRECCIAISAVLFVTAGSAVAQTYSYDAVGRMTHVDAQLPNELTVSNDYAYDSADNRIAMQSYSYYPLFQHRPKPSLPDGYQPDQQQQAAMAKFTPHEQAVIAACSPSDQVQSPNCRP